MPKKTLKSIHIQARLHPDKVREADAVAVYQAYVQRGYADRDIIREALIALGQAADQGWQPAEVINEVKLTDMVMRTLQYMESLGAKLSALDFSTLRTQGGESVDGDQVQQELSELQRSAKQMLGEAMFFDVNDDDE